MDVLTGFKIENVIHQSDYRIAYEGVREKDNLSVIIKTTTSEFSDPGRIAELKKEYELLLELKGPSIVRALDWIETNNRSYLILEKIEGVHLYEWLDSNPCSLEDFFKIALQLTSSLQFLHTHGWIHKDIKPSNILINPQLLEIYIIDFGLASKVQFAIQEGSQTRLHGTLAYLSPEQTGKIHAVIDQRSDLYSLGITFYQLLTGSLPFEYEDTLGAVYSHLAKNALPPSEINQEIPEILSKIILKMIEKRPQDRYQSAFGLQKDLEKALHFFQKTKNIPLFALGEDDYGSYFSISSEIFGRNKEIHSILEILNNPFNTNIILITGDPGAGKSFLIQHIESKIDQKIFIGRCEANIQKTPYYPLAQILEKLINLVLLADIKTINALKQKIKNSNGVNYKILEEIVPIFSFFTKDLPSIREENFIHSRQKLQEAIENVLTFFCEKEELIFIIEDIHWMEDAAFHIIEYLLMSPLPIKWIFTNRSQEDNPSRSLGVFLEKLVSFSKKPLFIQIDNLSPEMTHLLISKMLDNQSIEDLSTTLYQITQGNPFFIIEVLKTLFIEGNLKRNLNENNTWQWNKEGLFHTLSQSSLVDFMNFNIQKFSLLCQKFLGTAACIGANFTLDVLAECLDTSVQEVVITLEEPLKQGLLVKENAENIYSKYRFVHDKTREAAMKAFRKGEIEQIYLNIARTLIKKPWSKELPDYDHLNSILNHYNPVEHLIKDKTERNTIFELNYTLARYQKKMCAFEEAYRQYKYTLLFAPPNCWELFYKKMFSIFLDYGELNFITRHYDEGNKILLDLVSKAQSIDDRLETITVLTSYYQFLENTEIIPKNILPILEDLGVTVPETLSTWKFLTTFFIFLKNILFTNKEKLKELGFSKDESFNKSQTLIIILLSSYISYDKTFALFISLYGFNLAFKKGISPSIASGIHFFTLILFSLHQRHATYWYWIDLLWIYIKKIKTPQEHILFEGWWHGILATDRRLDKTAVLDIYSKEASVTRNRAVNIMGVVFKENISTLWALLWGTSVEDVSRHAEYVYNILESGMGKESYLFPTTSFYIYAINVLRGSDDWSQEKINTFQKSVEKVNDKNAQQRFYITLLWLNLSLCKKELLLDFVKKISSLHIYAIYPGDILALIFSGLALVRAAESMSFFKKKLYIQKIKKILKEVEWHKNINEKTFSPYFYLLKGSLSFLKKNLDETIQNYQKAIFSSSESGCFWVAAYANEQLALLWESKQEFDYASLHMEKALLYYQKWGCFSKIKTLKETLQKWGRHYKSKEFTSTQESSFSRNSFPGTAPHSSYSHGSSYSSTKTSLEELDLETVLKANSAISSEVVLSQLLKKLMTILIENASAQYGNLIFYKGEDKKIAARYEQENTKISIEEIPCTEENTPLSIINYVERTEKPLVLEEAPSSIFNKDPYIIRKKPLSILCMPIFYKNKKMGILYLENTCIPGLFAEKQISLLDLLVHQTAIAIENARIYDSMSRFIPREFLKILKKTSILDISKGDNIFIPNMSVLFCDIRNFTKYAEKIHSEELFEFINEFLLMVEPCIQNRSGVIDKYIGDAVMALFEDNAENAVFAASDILEKLKLWNQKRATQEKAPIDVTIGINTGPVVLGIIGGKERLEGSVMGDTVNTASRLQNLAKDFDTKILISEQTWNDLPARLQEATSLVAELQIRGRSATTQIFTLTKDLKE